MNQDNTRSELRKFKRFLNKNGNWICTDNACGLFDNVCNKCRFIDILNYAYKSNPKSDILTFSNSYLWEQFNELYYDYFKKFGGEEERNCPFFVNRFFYYITIILKNLVGKKKETVLFCK